MHDDAAAGRDAADASNPSTARFGEDFLAQVAAGGSELTAEEAAAVAALPSGSAILMIHRGAGTGSRFLLDGDSAIAGRHPDADVFLDDVTVSRRHAEFQRKGTVFSVRDLGSLNGTYVAGRLVDAATLDDGVDVQVGKFRLTFHASPLDLGVER